MICVLIYSIIYRWRQMMNHKVWWSSSYRFCDPIYRYIWQGPILIHQVPGLKNRGFTDAILSAPRRDQLQNDLDLLFPSLSQVPGVAILLDFGVQRKRYGSTNPWIDIVLGLEHHIETCEVSHLRHCNSRCLSSRLQGSSWLRNGFFHGCAGKNLVAQ